MHSLTLKLFYPVLLCGIVLWSAVAPAQTKSASDDDIQDVVFLGNQFPVFIRLHVRVDGRGYKAAWRRYVNRVFFDLDQDGDDVLTEREAHGIDAMHRPEPQREIVREGDVFRPPPPKKQVLPADTAPQDGRVTREELLAYLSKQGPQLFSVQSRPTAAPAQIVDEDGGDVFLQRVDRDGDGLLSREELTSMRETLFRHDWNDDEVLTKGELGSAAISGGVNLGRMMAAPTNDNDRIVAVPESSSGQQALLSRLLTKYGRSAAKYDSSGIEPLASQQGLDRDEWGWSAAGFARVDTDGDGVLNRDELQALWRNAQPAVEFVLRRGRRAPGEAAVELVAVDEVLLPSPPKVVGQADSFSVIFGSARLEFQGGGAWQASADVAAVFQQQFDALDADNNGYLELREIQNGPFFQKAQFRQMDGDADGKLFQKEMLAYLESQREAAANRTVLFVGERGRDLFDLFDTDADAQLGVRELMAAPRRLASYDQNGDGQLPMVEIPERIQLSLGAGQPAGLEGFAVAVSPFPIGTAGPQRRANAPEWFQRMDTNSDGDLSPREFLGPLAHFKKFDADADGLVSPEEATAAR